MSTTMIEYQQYIDAVINGILAMFTERERTNPAIKADYAYIEDMVMEVKNEYGEYDLRYPESISRPISDYYEDDEPVEKAVAELYPECHWLYMAHGSVL